MKRIQGQANRGAFTLIELLTVISIIAVLIGMMAVGMKKATMIAKNIRQKAEFKAMEVGLELFAKDFEDYPDSKVLPNATAANAVCGAQHLAEALVGRDSRGFDPITGWYSPSDQTYRPGLDAATLYNAADAASMNRRKQPYVEFKYSGIYTISDLWQAGAGSSNIYLSPAPPVTAANGRFLSPVITDTFNRNEITVGTTSVRVGMPVLYFKADGSKRFRVTEANALVTNPATADYSKWVYNFDDNLPVIQLPGMVDATLQEMDYKKDVGDTDPVRAQHFYESITQTADPGRVYYKPFNTDKFLLISAGWDGIYGTKDDITNFNY